MGVALPGARPWQGFTLIEMAIVIAIIALTIGGVFVGRVMVREGQIRAMLSEYDMYLRAIKEFQEKYQALPGDFGGNGTSGYSSAALATTLWGTDTGCPTTAYNATPKVATCDGDANGHIGDSTAAGVLSNSQEWWRAWQHLANAGFLNLQMTGAQGVNSIKEADIGINVPASKLPGAGWTLNYFQMQPGQGDTGLWGDQYGHLLNLGAYKSSDYTKNPVLTPAEAYEIDQKIDDSQPGTGKVRAWRTSVLPNCSTSGTDTSQTVQAYNITYSGSGYACSLVFLLGF